MEDRNRLSFVGEVNYEMLPQVLALAQYLPARKLNTEIWVCGPGGDFPLACGMVSLLRPLSRKTIAFGEVCSASAILAIAAPKGERWAYPETLYGLHEPYVTDQVEDPASAHATEELNVRMRQQFYALMQEFTGQDWRSTLEGKSMVWLSAQEAKRAGLVDNIGLYY